MENLVKIKLLSSDNYDTWCQGIKVLLMDRDRWEITKGIEIWEETASPMEKRQFASRRNRAFSMIYLNVNEEYRSLLQDKENPRKAWEVFKTKFLPDSRARIIG